MSTRFRELRDRLGFSQSGMASLAGVDQRTWSQWERRAPKQFERLAELARKAGVSEAWLLGNTSDPTPPSRDLTVAQRGAISESRGSWLDEIWHVTRTMTERGRAQLLRIAEVLAAEDRRWQRYDWLIREIDARDPTLVDRLEERLRELAGTLGSREAATDALIALLERDEAAQHERE